MIFKTFDSDIDGVINKIGVLGKSFGDIINTINQRKLDIDNLMSSGLVSSEKEAKNQVGNIWSYFFGVKSEQGLYNKIIVTKDNIQGYLKDISIFDGFDDTKASNLLSNLQELNSQAKTDKTVWSEYFKGLSEGEKWQEKFVQETDLSTASIENVKTAQQKAKAEAVAYNASLNNLTIGAKAANVALNGLKMAGNILVTMLISKGIELAVQAIDDYIHRIENIKKAAEEAKSAIDGIRDDFKSQSDTINEVKDKYAELAQSVENLGKTNQSRGKLSNDDYAEFLDLSNQLADAFPQLTKGYDDNGNAILNLSGNVNTITSSLENLLKVEQKIAQQEILDKMPDVWDGYKINIEEYEAELSKAQSGVDGFEKAISKIEYGKVKFKTGSDADKILKDALPNWWKDGHLYQSTDYGKNKGNGVSTWDLSTLSEEEFEKLKEKLGELGAKYEDEVQLVKDKISSANGDMSSYINTWLSQDFQFTNLQKESPELANGISEFLLNGDWASNLPQEAGTTWDEVSDWINSQFLYAIRNVNNKDIANAMTELFSNQELTPDEKYNLIKQISDYFGENSAITIMLKPELDNTADLRKSYDDAISSAKEKYNEDLTPFFEENSINTQEEIDKWREIAQSCDTATEAKKKYLEADISQETPISC
nr:MAG TPA: minor tail protein [Caudoviricetes sp.]